MKKILTIVFAIIATSALAQKTDTVLFKGATKIIANNSLSASENYKAVGQALVDNGYTIEKKDSEFGQIISGTFKPRFKKETPGGLSAMSFVIKDNQITLTGKYNPNNNIRIVSWMDNPSTFRQVVYSKNALAHAFTFYMMQDFVKKIPHDKITYSE